MSHSPRVVSNEPAIDDYPVRPNAIREDEKRPNKLKGQTRSLVVLSLIYFLYGTGISIYGLLYPALARKYDLSSWMYGSVISSSFLITIIFYPVACRIVSKVSIRNSLSVGIFVIGSCRILFGTLYLISKEESFIAISYSVQLVEGIGTSILIASTVVTASTFSSNQMKKYSLSVQSCLCLGLSLGPIGGQVVNDELGFDILFYIIGGLTVLSFILTATIVQEPEQQVTFQDIPIIQWMKNKKMLIYFFITLATFIYVGFLSVSLELILKKFNLNSLYSSMMFSLSPFVYGITISGWNWIIKKGFNNVMTIFIGSLAIVASLILLGPAPFTTLKASLMYVCWALALQGLGVACKCSCILDASEKDLRFQTNYSEVQQKLLVPTIFMMGAASGYFCGTLTAGIMDYYIGYKKATIALFAVEICIAIGCVVFGLNRNYISKKRREGPPENQPILSS